MALSFETVHASFIFRTGLSWREPLQEMFISKNKTQLVREVSLGTWKMLNVEGMSETVATARRYKTHWFSKGQVYEKLWRGRREDQKLRLVILKMHKMDRVQIRPKSVERFMVSSLPLFLVNLIIYAWFNLTCYHASQAYPQGFAIFFSRGVLFPGPGHAEGDKSPPPSSWSTSYTFFGYIFLRTILIFERIIAKPDVCRSFMNQCVNVF